MEVLTIEEVRERLAGLAEPGKAVENVKVAMLSRRMPLRNRGASQNQGLGA